MFADITIYNKTIFRIDASNIKNILNLYPDEKLWEHGVFQEILETGKLRLDQGFMRTVQSMNIPWQLFCLTTNRLDEQLDKMKAQRLDQPAFFVANRANNASRISTRMADRIIGWQAFLNHRNQNLRPNLFLGAFPELQAAKLAQQIIDSLEIDMLSFRSLSKGKALQYLIECAERQQFGVARVVYDHGLLPRVKQSREAYNRSSGFIIYDKNVPFLFLPAASGLDEAPGRQIYTLLLLITMAFKGYHNLLLIPNKEERFDQIEGYSTKEEQILYEAVNEILLPKCITNDFVGIQIKGEHVRKWANKYNLTPRATLVILAMRNLVKMNDIELVKPPQKSGGMPLSSSMAIRKLCGDYTSRHLIQALRNKDITSTQFEHLLCGIRNKRITSALIKEGLL